MPEILDGAVCPHPDCAPPRNPNFLALDLIDEVVDAALARGQQASNFGPSPSPMLGPVNEATEYDRQGLPIL